MRRRAVVVVTLGVDVAHVSTLETSLVGGQGMLRLGFAVVEVLTETLLDSV
jgi:hypothetical protein